METLVLHLLQLLPLDDILLTITIMEVRLTSLLAKRHSRERQMMPRYDLSYLEHGVMAIIPI